MKVVVADTSPVNYLVLIDCARILQQLYTHILIPAEVFEELTAAGAPVQVAAWARKRPDWVEVRPPSQNFSPGLEELDAGEQAAIRLALEERDVLLLIDEAAGRAAATKLGVPNTGTLGVLVAASREKIIELRPCIEKLRLTNFRISQALIDELL